MCRLVNNAYNKFTLNIFAYKFKSFALPERAHVRNFAVCENTKTQPSPHDDFGIAFQL